MANFFKFAADSTRTHSRSWDSFREWFDDASSDDDTISLGSSVHSIEHYYADEDKLHLVRRPANPARCVMQ